jgi:urease subunit beta
VTPGEIRYGEGPIQLNGKDTIELEVRNDGDRPIQVGSHYHFAESNSALVFDRDAAWGMRLDVAAGTSKRFEPNIPQLVSLVPIGGRRLVPGLQIEHERKGPNGELDAAHVLPVDEEDESHA